MSSDFDKSALLEDKRTCKSSSLICCTKTWLVSVQLLVAVIVQIGRRSRVPEAIYRSSQKDRELSFEIRNAWFSTIKRLDITQWKILQLLVCNDRFFSGKIKPNKRLMQWTDLSVLFSVALFIYP